ncbi:site-specific integrase [Xanthomonas hortorum]|uniref:site-specific integrase n=1 Tax=Xanthomonas hortorum TaxID=56454 RepID=UPI001594A61E|nr:site-specific integrase [Xanthomonas hortorum]NHF64523.1 site-specific integrase [Xanthomonas hortorum]
MKHDPVLQDDARELRVPPAWGLTRTKSGIEFDPNADIWAYRDGVNNVFLDFKQLPNAVQLLCDSAKSVLTWYAENRSPDHLHNMFRRLQHFLRAAPKELSRISDVDLLNYRAGLDESTEWYLGSLSGLLRKWAQLGYPGVGEDVELLLKQLRLKGNAKGVSVLTWNPHDGPFTHIEEEALQAALNQAYAEGDISTGDYALAWLFILLGQRSKQYASLKVCDLQLKRDADGILKYSVMIPSAKKGAKFSRAQFVERPIIEQFGEVLNSYAEKVRLSFRSILDDASQAPLFPSSRSPGDDNGFAFHQTAADVGAAITAVLEGLSVVSERTGKAMNISGVRFRRTIGTRAGEEGYSPLVIARLLDHSDTQNVGVYSANSPAIIERIDRAIAIEMAPLAQAFAGTLVEGLGEDTSRRIIDLRVDRSGSPMGDCGTHGYCGFNAPIACYTCSNFEAWLDGPHEAVLQHLLGQREKHLRASDARIASINDRTIFAVAAVIEACRQAKAPRSSHNGAESNG